MAKCPKCGDPIESGETFCGKCGTTLTPSAPPMPPTPAAGQPVTYVPKTGGKKTWLWIVIAVVAIVAVVLVLWLSGVFSGGSAAIVKYVKSTAPEFQNVTDSIGKLNKVLTWESSGDTEKDIKNLETELNQIKDSQAAAETANNKLAALSAPKEITKLDTDLRDFYGSLKTDLSYRYEIIDYFYTTEKIGDRLSKAAGTREEYTDMAQVQEAFRQLKYSLDQSVAELEQMKVPDSLKTIHENDLKILKQMSTILGDMVTEITNQDAVGLTASITQFEGLTSEYDTKVTKKYQEILEPEFASLNQALESAMTKKDTIKDEFSQLRGKYNIQGAAMEFLKAE